MASPWTRLIRFEDESKTERFGQPVNAEQDIGLAYAANERIEAYLIDGDIFSPESKVTERKATVRKLLSPISREQCSLIRCLGLNYKAHAKEAGMAEPTAPVLFIKPRTSLAGPGDIPVSKHAQDQLDFETELACVIGKDAKDVSEEEALKYVLGWTGSNDVSARKLQMQTSQWCFGKGFDSSCPLGPVLVRNSSIDPDNIDLRGVLAGETMQDSNTKDMIFNCRKTIALLSRGTTLEKGTVIQLGTPFGIGWAREPKRIIKNGETIEMFFSGGIGTLVNRFVYE